MRNFKLVLDVFFRDVPFPLLVTTAAANTTYNKEFFFF
jgi:hypothetical protein